MWTALLRNVCKYFRSQNKPQVTTTNHYTHVYHMKLYLSFNLFKVTINNCNAPNDPIYI